MYLQFNTILLSNFFVGWTIERIYFYFIFNKTKKLPINLYTPINIPNNSTNIPNNSTNISNNSTNNSVL
jgi:hypothetical protein